MVKQQIDVYSQLKERQVGPVGLMGQKAACLHGANRVIAIDPLDYRLEKAKAVNNVDMLNPHEVDAVGFEPERSFMDKVKATVNFEKDSMKVQVELAKDVKLDAGLNYGIQHTAAKHYFVGATCIF